MSIVLYYTPGTCALACMVALEWLGHPYALCRVEREARASDAFRRINPRSQVPAMEAEGSILVEANAILAHIADRDLSRSLLPTSGTERALANQLLSYFASGFHAVFWPYFRPDRYTTEPSHEPSVKAAAEAAVRRELGVMNEHLAGRTYVLGERRTLLDPYLHAMDRWANPFVDMRRDYPHVFEHQKTMAAEPAVRFATALERSANTPLEGTACTAHRVFG